MIQSESNANVGQMLSQAGLNFLGTLINAKEKGQKLPKVFDIAATIAMKGENKAIEIAQKEAKKEMLTTGAWVLVAILIAIVIYLLAKRNS